jgi:hypothetical protein
MTPDKFGQTADFSIELVLVIVCGICSVWIWPHKVRREAEAGKITEEQAQAKIKKSKWGYLFFVAAILQIVSKMTGF